MLVDLISGTEQATKIVPLSCHKSISCAVRHGDAERNITGADFQCLKVNGDLQCRILFNRSA